MADNIANVTDSNFQAEVIDASKTQPVMVDFWADWCRPCHMLSPTVAEIAADYAGRLKVVKLNVDENVNSGGPLQHSRHSHAAHFQGRPGGRADRRRRSQGPDRQGRGSPPELSAAPKAARRAFGTSRVSRRPPRAGTKSHSRPRIPRRALIAFARGRRVG